MSKTLKIIDIYEKKIRHLPTHNKKKQTNIHDTMLLENPQNHHQELLEQTVFQ